MSLALVSPADATCTVRTTGLAFGSYDVFNPAPLDSTGSVIYRCTQREKDIRITFDSGGALSFNPRRMSQGTGTDSLEYNLYVDAARTVVWGNGALGTQPFFEHNPQVNNGDIVVPIYGRVPARQNVREGNYSDTIIVIVEF